MPVWQAGRMYDGMVTVSSYSKASVGCVNLLPGTTVPATANWPTANKAIYVPFRLGSPNVIAQLWWYNGTKSGTPNVDCGIYAAGADGSGRRLISTGSTAQGTGSVLQAVDVTDTPIAPGLYYMALACDVNSTGFFRAQINTPHNRAIGMAQQTTAFPLPATATFATVGQDYIPVFGFTARSVL